MSLSKESISEAIVHCQKCPRLLDHCQNIAQTKRRAFQNENYWGRPVPSLGSLSAELLVVGLAPAAHGANRTGRIFTGDRSGEWLYRALFQSGFSNQPNSDHLNDGLQLLNARVTCVVHCAPPENQPSPSELTHCHAHLEAEIQSMPRTRVWIALGKIAYEQLWKALAPQLKRPLFKHGAHHAIPGRGTIILSYHPSQQNTFTGRLSAPMFQEVFEHAEQILSN